MRRLTGWQWLWLAATAVWGIAVIWYLDQYRTDYWSVILADPMAWLAIGLEILVPAFLAYGVGALVARVIRSTRKP